MTRCRGIPIAVSPRQCRQARELQEAPGGRLDIRISVVSQKFAAAARRPERTPNPGSLERPVPVVAVDEA